MVCMQFVYISLGFKVLYTINKICSFCNAHTRSNYIFLFQLCKNCVYIIYFLHSLYYSIFFLNTRSFTQNTFWTKIWKICARTAKQTPITTSAWNYDLHPPFKMLRMHTTSLAANIAIKTQLKARCARRKNGVISNLYFNCVEKFRLLFP